MKFDDAAANNPIDELKVVGRPTERIDGPLKTSGTAPYAYERHDVAPDAAYGYVLGSAIAKGRIRSMDTSRARRAPGVLAVVTAETAGPIGKGNLNKVKLLGGPDIQHYHQAIAVVVANTFEQARAAASLIAVQYDKVAGAYDLTKAKDSAITPPPGFGGPSNSDVGDFSGAFAAAPVKVDATYTTPSQSHAMMEPHATVAAWKGDELTLWTSNQMIDWSRGDVAATLKMPKEKVRLVSPFIGGGFGGKLFVRADAILAALGARAAKRPVKVALPRPLMANNTTHRGSTIQRIRIGATPDGKITAIAHESWQGDQQGGSSDPHVLQTRKLYAGPNRMTRTRLAILDLPEHNAMRAPGEASGMMALEVAMDEMAEKLGMDPVQFRILNDTQVDPEHPEKSFSQRQLVQCLRQGAERFGWNRRNPRPAQVHEGRWLIGHGMAAAFRGAPVMKSAARVRLEDNGLVVVETDMTDIGTGSYTILAQTAAETLGVPLHQVRVRLGDSNFPVSSGSGGQWGAASSTSGVYAACMKLREQVAAKFGMSPTQTTFVDGQVRSGEMSFPLAQAVGMAAEDTIEFGKVTEQYELSTFGGHFVEVAVDTYTAEIKVRRMLAVCAAGRIINPISARSQVIGAMTMGVGSALMEDLVIDTRRGFFVNHDLAGYEVPVHADIPHQEVIFLKEVDAAASPLKAKGVGELGICGVAAAIANAVYNATGVRVRDYPITLDKLLSGMPRGAAA